MSALSILVLERHPLMRAALVAAIAAEPDMEAAEPSNNHAGAIELTLAGRKKPLYLPAAPDVILLALGNPGQDDLRALSDLRLLLPETPVLALTSNEVPGQEQAALDCGAQAVVTKSAQRSELIRALRSIHSESHPIPSPETPKEAKIGPKESTPVIQGTPTRTTQYLERKTQ